MRGKGPGLPRGVTDVEGADPAWRSWVGPLASRALRRPALPAAGRPKVRRDRRIGKWRCIWRREVAARTHLVRCRRADLGGCVRSVAEGRPCPAPEGTGVGPDWRLVGGEWLRACGARRVVAGSALLAACGRAGVRGRRGG